MLLMDIYKNEENKKALLPIIPAVLWVLFSIISLFTIDYSLIKDPFVIISILVRFGFSWYAYSFIKLFYIKKGLKPINYNHHLNFIGYAISLTYVSYMLPGVVLDFYKGETVSILFVVMVLLSTLCPLSIYLLLRSSFIKLATGYFSQKEVDLEKKIKKDKKLKKQNQKRLRSERTFLQNFWFEVADPLMWAILWVLLINNTLFQLYEIPSSSMVPEFLVKDRVVASKFLSGPALPLTRYQAPEIRKPQIGDIVTFNNPKIDDPESSLRYKSVFTRIFQPFVYMLTFSNVDIDTDEFGNPKARQLVKRVIAEPGEKISMVNDKVYKKREGGEWTLMSEIEGEEEYGKNSLFSINSPNSGAQYINPQLREELDYAARLVEESEIDDLEFELKRVKSEFITLLNGVDRAELLNSLITYDRINSQRVQSQVDALAQSYDAMMKINRLLWPEGDKKSAIQEFNTNLDDYKYYVVHNLYREFSEIIEWDLKTFDEAFITEILLPDNPSPYDIFVYKLDALNRLNKFILFNKILNQESVDAEGSLIYDLKVISVYVDGFPFLGPHFFGAGNFPEYPVGEGNYIPDNEYFLLGDNRYNSLDSRMGDSFYEISLTEKETALTEKVYVNWDAHTIGDEYIHGRVQLIVFPLDRFKLF